MRAIFFLLGSQFARAALSDDFFAINMEIENPADPDFVDAALTGTCSEAAYDY